jgi:hypothetical protein
LKGDASNLEEVDDETKRQQQPKPTTISVEEPHMEPVVVHSNAAVFMFLLFDFI